MTDNSQALLNLLERVLGRSKKTGKGNYAFMCPNSCHATKPKLEINTETQRYSCWICNSTHDMKGQSIASLFKKLKVSQDKVSELKLISPSSKISQSKSTIPSKVELPKEFIPLYDESTKETRYTLRNIASRRALQYVYSRGINDDDIIKYNIGFCWEGKYENRIIIPSYDENAKLNYFVSRDFTDAQKKYDNPPIPIKTIIPFELYINFNLPLILVEGVFDALTIRRNVIPLMGKVIHSDGMLMKKIVTSKVKKIYIALDKDAMKDSLKYCEELIKIGKEVYLVELDGKDANEMGFENFLNILEKTPVLRFQDLIAKKLSLI